MAAEPEDFSGQTIEERLANKSWKARLSAYQDLVALFKQTVDESDPAFRPYTNHPAGVREWVRDSNAVSQEKGVEAAIALVEWGGKTAARTRSEVVPSLVEKCLGSARAGTKTKAIELCLLYVEVEEDMGEGVITDLLPGLDVKQPKAVAGTVSVLASLILLFGPKTVSPKPLLRVLPKIFGHADKAVRAEGTQLALALHAHLGPALTPHLSELKPVQQKELGEAFVEADAKGEGFGKVKQTRFTRSQQRERDVKEAQVTLEGSAGEDGNEAADTAGDSANSDEAPPDPFDFADPVDVLSSLPTDFYTHLSSPKWKDRKELALEPLLALVQAVRLKPANYEELTRALGQRMTDANVVCVALAANCLEGLAKGLRGEFGRYWKGVGGLVLARTKEKKASVLDALGAALDAMFLTISIGDITEEVVTFAKDKNPSVKAETFKFLVRSLKVTPTPPPKVDLQPLVDVLKLALEDSVEPVRVAAAEALGTLMKVVGERALGGQIEALDDLRKAKVKEMFEKAEVRCKPGAGAPTSKVAPAAVVAAPKPKPKPLSVAPKTAAAPIPSPPAPLSPLAPPKAAPPARFVAKKPPVASTSAAAPPPKKPVTATAGGAKPPPPPAKSNEPLKYKMSQEDAEAQAETVLPEAIVKELADTNWKVRLAAIESLQSWLEGGEFGNVEAELVVRFLSKKPGWKESNFQVSSKMFGIFQLLAEKSPSFAKGSAALSIPALSDKLGDIKLKKPAGDALTTYAEKTSLGFVLGQAYEPMTKQKAPKAQADSLVWVEQALRDFGIVGLSVRDLIEFLKVALKSSNAAVRTSATKTLVTLRLYVGDGISSFIQDLNPTLLTTIEGEFVKVAGESPPEPTRFSADMAVAAASAAPGKGNGASGGGDALDELFPRVDLERLVSSATIAACNDANWKTRKEALELIQGVLDANKRLKPSNLSDLTSAMKLRMTDSNKVVQGLALDVVARIATGMGKPFDKIARILTGPVAGVLADAKVNIRVSGTTTLSAMADAVGLDPLIGGLDKPLETPNPVLRKELLAWLEARFADPDAIATLDLSSLVNPIIACLEDKSADVRKSATALLPVFVAQCGFAHVMDQTSKLKPASRSTVAPLIEAARGSALVGPLPTKASAPTVAAAMGAPPRPAGGPSRATAKVIRPTAMPPPAVEDAPSRSSAPGVRPRPSVSGIRKAVVPARQSSPAPSLNAKTPPFRNADPDPKRVRAAKETGSLKWAVDGLPRPDQVESLFQQMAPNTSPDLLIQLFSKDHNAERDYVAALTVLDDCAREPSIAASFDLLPEEMRARLVANVDVIFKYITLRVGLTSTTITVKCLDLIDHLIPVLDLEGHKLSDYETSALLLSLINKVGDGKETIRQRVRAIFQRICNVYPFSKVFATLLENGLTSKNARTRAESVEELGGLIARHGVGPFPIPKALPLIAKLISDRDAAVRTAALTTIGAAYTLIGADAVHKYIGAMPDKERSMLDERLKRTTGGAAPPSRSDTPVQRSVTAFDESKPASAPPSPPRTATTPAPASSIVARAPTGLPAPKGKISGLSRIGSGLPLSVVASNSLNTSTGSATPPTESHTPRKPSGSGLPTRQAIPRLLGPSSSSIPASSIRPARPRRDTVDDDLGPLCASPADMTKLVTAVATDDLAQSIEALKRLQREISAQPAFLIPFADDLMDSVTQQMSLGFTSLNETSSASVLRLCKHLMQTLTAFFDHKNLGQAVSTEALTMLLAELTGRLLDTADNPPNEQIASLSKVLNMVLIRIFHHSDQTACFSALFSVLHDATTDLRELRGTELTDRAKYAELVMKCLWKVSKTVKESLEENALSASRLLRDINAFLDSIPPAEWRRRATDSVPLADMPLRTVKTILQQIVSVYGEQVFDHLEEIDTAENSFVYQYLFRLSSTDGAGSNGRESIAESSLRRPSSSATLSAPVVVRQLSSASLPSENSPSLPVIDSPVLGGLGTSEPNGAASPTTASGSGGAEIEMNQRLKSIFDLIGDPVNSRNGIAELYEYQKKHPEAAPRISTWMSGTGNYFQTYLRRALENLASADRERLPPGPSPADSRVRSTSNSGSSGSGTPARPISTFSQASSPRTSARMSFGPGGVLSPASNKLQELKSVFGAS